MSSEVVLKVEVLSILSEHKHAADAPFILSFFWLFTILLSPLTQTQYTLCFSSLSYPSNLFLFTLHLPPVSQHSHRVLCFPLCCGSRSSISLSELSGACCPETANIRDVVINGTSIFPPPTPEGPPVGAFSTISPNHIACAVVHLSEA